MKIHINSIILFLISHKVISIPFKENELISDVTNNTDILEDKLYDILPNNIEDTVDVTDVIIENEVEFSSDEEEQTTLAIDPNECTSVECIEISKRILSSLDTSINPCEDFYEFSCGGWIQNNIKKSNGYTIFTEIRDKITNDLYEVLESNYQVNDKLSKEEQERDESIFNSMKNVYTHALIVLTVITIKMKILLTLSINLILKYL